MSALALGLALTLVGTVFVSVLVRLVANYVHARRQSYRSAAERHQAHGQGGN